MPRPCLPSGTLTRPPGPSPCLRPPHLEWIGSNSPSGPASPGHGDTTVRHRGIGASISDSGSSGKRVPIFPFATQGGTGKQASSYFRQRNWVQAREASGSLPSRAVLGRAKKRVATALRGAQAFLLRTTTLTAKNFWLRVTPGIVTLFFAPVSPPSTTGITGCSSQRGPLRPLCHCRALALEHTPEVSVGQMNHFSFHARNAFHKAFHKASFTVGLSSLLAVSLPGVSVDRIRQVGTRRTGPGPEPKLAPAYAQAQVTYAR